MALTATATPKVEMDIKKLLRSPVTVKASINRPNIELHAFEIQAGKDDYCATFSEHVSDITQGEPAIVYTDFIADVGCIVSSLNEIGIEAVGYYEEMDARDRMESYTKCKSGEAKIMVATKAFGMGINKHDIRHVIRNGVPESIVAWAQELGRAGRDGKLATATVMYRKSDIRHADAWIWNNLGNTKEYLETMLPHGGLPRHTYQVLVEERFSCGCLVKMMKMQWLITTAVMCAIKKRAYS